MAKQQIQNSIRFWSGVAVLGALTLGSTLAEDAKPNELSAAEKEAGWKLLFDGKTTTGWHGFQKPAMPEQGWVVEDGWLRHQAKVKAGDIITTELFNDFELSWEWKISPSGNSGVKYFVDEKRADKKGKLLTYATAHEYQMLDDEGHPDGKKGTTHRTAAWYDVLAATNAKVKPVGEINLSRLVVKGPHVEHWLNGDKVVEYEVGSAEAEALIAKSKFKDVTDFNKKIETPILLQDHGDDVWFRNIKLRSLPAK